MDLRLIFDEFTEHEILNNNRQEAGTLPRLKRACRNQYELKSCLLDDIIPQDHLARDVWNYVELLDLSISLNQIKSLACSPGRPATDPKILLSIWLYATIRGISSARLIEEYTEEHAAFIWLCGGVKLNYHTIADFRVQYELLDGLLTQSVASLAEAGIISLEQVSQDGVRVRANAGDNTFRREGTLTQKYKLAQQLVEDLANEAKKSPSACKSRQEAAKKRAAEEKVERLEAAIQNLKKLQEEKIERKKKKGKEIKEEDLKNTRASTTDAEARVMKMAGGGFRPCYNIQFATSNKGKATVGVDVICRGVDNGQITNMINQIVRRYKKFPSCWLVDNGYMSQEDLVKVDNEYPGCQIYLPKCATEANKDNIYEENHKDSIAVKKWKERMRSEEGKEIYKQRSETAEWTNAQARNRGLQQIPVRGVQKTRCIALLYGLVQNMMIAFSARKKKLAMA